jgi:hypothetical protein
VLPGADYVGCMKTGVVIKTPRQRWYEPQHAVLGGSDSSYFTHAWGPIYVVSGRVAEDLAALRPGSLRFFNNEGNACGFVFAPLGAARSARGCEAAVGCCAALCRY